MSEFKTIETQEQLDAVIGDRIKRERETLSKKYEGFLSPEDVKKAKEELETEISNLNKQLEDANLKIASHDQELAERDNRIKSYESHSVKSRIAHEVGLSYDAINFLQGEDEDSIRQSAETLKNLVGANNVAPLASNEPSIAEGDAALLNTLRNLEKGE